MSDHQVKRGMSALDQKQTLQQVGAVSAFPPKADIVGGSECPLCANSGHQTVIRLLHLRVAGTIRESSGQASWQS